MTENFETTLSALNLANDRNSSGDKVKTADLFKIAKANFSKINFPIPEAQIAFTQLSKAFIKSRIFQYFDKGWHIWIRTDTSGFAIEGVLSQMTLDQLFFSDMIRKTEDFSNCRNGQWYPIALFF